MYLALLLNVKLHNFCNAHQMQLIRFFAFVSLFHYSYVVKYCIHWMHTQLFDSYWGKHNQSQNTFFMKKMKHSIKSMTLKGGVVIYLGI